MADNSEDSNSPDVRAAAIIKANRDREKQEKTSFDAEVHAYLEENHPVEFFDSPFVKDAKGEPVRMYNPASRNARRDAKPEAEKVIARKRAAEHITQLQKKPVLDAGVGKKWVVDYVEDKSKRRPLSMPEYFGKKYLGITPEGSESIPLKPVWQIDMDPNEPRLVAQQAAEAALAAAAIP